MVKVHDPKKIMVVWGGVAITGFAENSMVTSEKNEENSNPSVGALGEVTQMINSDNTGMITLSLKGNSSSIAMLSADAQSNVIKSAQIIDMNNGAVNAGGSQAWIAKTPSLMKGKEVGDIDVEIFVVDYSVS